MSEHEAYGGITCDHLYQRCPALQRAVNGQGGIHRQREWVGLPLITTVDPLGSDVCGWCRSVYLAEKMQ